MLTKHLSLCVIAVDWSSYPTKDFHILRASLICDGRSIPLLSQVVPCAMQQNSDIQNEFLDVLSGSINPASRVIIITDAGFHNAWFKHIPESCMPDVKVTFTFKKIHRSIAKINDLGEGKPLHLKWHMTTDLQQKNLG